MFLVSSRLVGKGSRTTSLELSFPRFLVTFEIIHWFFSSLMFYITEGCTVSFSLSSAQGRGRPWWPRQTRSWAPSGSGQSTRDTLLLPHLWPSPNPVTGINVKMIVSARGMWSVVGCCLMKERTNLRISDGSKSLLFQLINRLFVLPEVKLCTNQNNRNLWTMMPNLTNDSSINAQIQRAHWSDDHPPQDTIWLSHSRSWLGSRGRSRSGTRPEICILLQRSLRLLFRPTVCG